MDYTVHKQTLSELSVSYSKSITTIRKYFDQIVIKDKFKYLNKKEGSATYPKSELNKDFLLESKTNPSGLFVVLKPRINLCIDVTFFGNTFGVIVARGNPESKDKYVNLYWKYVFTETVQAYYACILHIQQYYQIVSFTVDNKTGLISFLEKKYPFTPIQLCQYHVVASTFRNITRNPKTICAKEVRCLILKLKYTDKKEFTLLLEELILNNLEFIQKRNSNGEYIHKPVRTALTTLRNNLKYIFSYDDYPNLLIPKTNNTSEGSFGHLKGKIKLHRGLEPKRMQRMIDELLSQK